MWKKETKKQLHCVTYGKMVRTLVGSATRERRGGTWRSGFHFQLGGWGQLCFEAETEWGLEGGLGAWGEHCGWNRVGEEKSSKTGGRELTGSGCGGLRGHAEGLCSQWSGRWWRVLCVELCPSEKKYKRFWSPNPWSLWTDLIWN